MLTAVLISKPKWFGLQIQVQHVLLSLIYAGFGASLGYLKAEPTLDLVAALSSWATLKPLLIGALMAFLAGLLGQAQKSLFGAPTSTPPAAAKKTVPFPGDSDPNVPPAAQRQFKGYVLAPIPFALLIATVGLTACNSVPPNVPGQVQDGISLYQCIQKNWGQPFLTVVATCLPGEFAAVADVIADITVFLRSQADAGSDGGLAMNPYEKEPIVIEAMPKAIERAKAKK